MNLISPLECLIAFTIVYATVGAAQRGKARLKRHGSSNSPASRSQRSRVSHRRFEQPRERSTSLRDVYDRPRGSSLHSGEALFDGDRRTTRRGRRSTWRESDHLLHDYSIAAVRVAQRVQPDVNRLSARAFVLGAGASPPWRAQPPHTHEGGGRSREARRLRTVAYDFKKHGKRKSL